MFNHVQYKIYNFKSPLLLFKLNNKYYTQDNEEIQSMKALYQH